MWGIPRICVRAEGETHLDGEFGLVGEPKQRVEVDEVLAAGHRDDVAGEVRQQEVSQVVGVDVHMRREPVGRDLRVGERGRGDGEKADETQRRVHGLLFDRRVLLG